jgi:predicted transcriptional regulator
MDLKTVLTVLEGESLLPHMDLDREVKDGCGADLMSDVLAYAHQGSVLMTGLTHPQVVRTAEMAGMAAIVFVRAKRPPQETLDLAKEIGIPLLSTRYTMFEACGRLYAAGMLGTGFCESYSILGCESSTRDTNK